jgi:osmotically-inducible protein OsmY
MTFRRTLTRSALSPAALLIPLALACTLAGGCAPSDTSVQTYVQQRLAADPATANARLTVTVSEGVAHIKGETETLAQQQRAVDIATAVKGVKQVQSEMRLNDTAMTDEIKKAIAADASLSQIPLRIEVQNAEVKLFSDKTNSDERAKLKDVAAGVPGVVHVEDHMK